MARKLTSNSNITNLKNSTLIIYFYVFGKQYQTNGSVNLRKPTILWYVVGMGGRVEAKPDDRLVGPAACFVLYQGQLWRCQRVFGPDEGN